MSQYNRAEPSRSSESDSESFLSRLYNFGGWFDVLGSIILVGYHFLDLLIEKGYLNSTFNPPSILDVPRWLSRASQYLRR